MVKPDGWIREMAWKHGMIDPFAEGKVRPGIISFGLSSFGYDMRISNTFKVFEGSGLLDPKQVTVDSFTGVTTDVFEMPPTSSVLAQSVEYFRIPRDVIVNVTPFEPAWEGFVTISITNTNSHPVKLYAGEGIAQVLFLAGDGPCERSYADKKGKYQAQKDITISKVDSDKS